MGPSHRTFLQSLSDSERKALIAHAETSTEGGGSNRSSCISYSGQSELEQAKQLIERERERRRLLEAQVSSLQTALKDQALRLEEVRSDRDGLRQSLQRYGERGTRLAGQLASLEQENAALSAKLLAASGERTQLLSKLETQQMRIIELQQGYVSLASSCNDDGLERRDLLRRSKMGGLLRDAAAAGVLDVDLQQELGIMDRPATYKTTGGTIAALTRERDALQQRVHELSGRLAEAVGRESAARGAQALRSASWKRAAVQAEARLTAALKRVKELNEELRKRDSEGRQRDKYIAQLERTVMAQHRSLQQQRRMLEAGAAAQSGSRGEGVCGATARAAGNQGGNPGQPQAPVSATASAAASFGCNDPLSYSPWLGAASAAAAVAADGVPGYGSGPRFAWAELSLADLVASHGASPPKPGREGAGAGGQEPQQRPQQQGARPLESWRGAWMGADLPAAPRDGAPASAVAEGDGAKDWLPQPLGTAAGTRPGVLGRQEPGEQVAGGGVNGRVDLLLARGAMRDDVVADRRLSPSDLPAVRGRSSSPPPAVVLHQLTTVEASLAQLYQELEEFKDYSLLGRDPQERGLDRDRGWGSRQRGHGDDDHEEVDADDGSHSRDGSHAGAREEGAHGLHGRGFGHGRGSGSGGGSGGGGTSRSAAPTPSSPSLPRLGEPFEPSRSIRLRGEEDLNGPRGWPSHHSDGELKGTDSDDDDRFSDPGPGPGSASFAFPPSPTPRPHWSPSGSPSSRLRPRAWEQLLRPHQQTEEGKGGGSSRSRSPVVTSPGGGSRCGANGTVRKSTVRSSRRSPLDSTGCGPGGAGLHAAGSRLSSRGGCQREVGQRQPSSPRPESLRGRPTASASVAAGAGAQANAHAPTPLLSRPGYAQSGSNGITRTLVHGRRVAAGRRGGGDDDLLENGMPTFARWSGGAAEAEGARGPASGGGGTDQCSSGMGRGGGGGSTHRGSPRETEQPGCNSGGGSYSSSAGGGVLSHDTCASERSTLSGSQQPGAHLSGGESSNIAAAAASTAADSLGASGASATVGDPGPYGGQEQAAVGDEAADERPRKPLPTHMLGHLLRCSHYGPRKVSPQRGASRCKTGAAAGCGSGGCATAAAPGPQRHEGSHRMQPGVRLDAGSPPPQGHAAKDTAAGGSGANSGGVGSEVSGTVVLLTAGEVNGRAGLVTSVGRGSYTDQHNIRVTAGAQRQHQRRSPVGIRVSRRSRSPVGACSPAFGRIALAKGAEADGWERRDGKSRPTSPDPMRGAQRSMSPGRPGIPADRCSPRSCASDHSSPRYINPASPASHKPDAVTRPDDRSSRGPETQPHSAFPIPPSPEALSPISTLLANLKASPQGPSRSVTMPNSTQASVSLEQGRDDTSGYVDQRQQQGHEGEDVGVEGSKALWQQQGDGKALGTAAAALGRTGAKRRPHDDTVDGADDRRKARGGSSGGERPCSSSSSGHTSDRGWAANEPSIACGIDGASSMMSYDDGGATGLWQPSSSGWQTKKGSHADPARARSLSGSRCYNESNASGSQDFTMGGGSSAPGAPIGGPDSKSSYGRPTLAGWLGEPPTKSSSSSHGCAASTADGQSAPSAAGAPAAGAAATALQRLRDKRRQRAHHLTPQVGLRHHESARSACGSEFGSVEKEEVPRRRHYPAASGGSADCGLRRACTGEMVLTLRGSLLGEVVVSPRVLTPRDELTSPRRPRASGGGEGGGEAVFEDDAGELSVMLEMNSSSSGGRGEARGAMAAPHQPLSDTTRLQQDQERKRQQMWWAAKQGGVQLSWGGSDRQQDKAVDVGPGTVMGADGPAGTWGRTFDDQSPMASSCEAGEGRDGYVARTGSQGGGEAAMFGAALQGDERAVQTFEAASPGSHPLMQLLGQASEDLQLLSNRLKPLVGTGT